MTRQNLASPAFDTALRPPKPHITEELPQAPAAYPCASPPMAPARERDGHPSRVGPDVYQRDTLYAQWLRGDTGYTTGLVFMGLLALIAGFSRQIIAYMAAALAPSWGKFTGLCAIICLVAAVYPWFLPLCMNFRARCGRLMAQLKVRYLSIRSASFTYMHVCLLGLRWVYLLTEALFTFIFVDKGII